MRLIEHYFATDGESFQPDPKEAPGEVLVNKIKVIKEEMAALRNENTEVREPLDNQAEFNKVLLKEIQRGTKGT